MVDTVQSSRDIEQELGFCEQNWVSFHVINGLANKCGFLTLEDKKYSALLLKHYF